MFSSSQHGQASSLAILCMSAMVPHDGENKWRAEWMDERHKRSYRNSAIILSGRIGERDEDRNGWREGWQASAQARSLTTVRKGA